MTPSTGLLNGHDLPMLGLGTWDLRGTVCETVIPQALEMGYRHIDTAWMYENQREVGVGLRASGVARDQYFLTSKIWKTHLRPGDVRTQHAENLEQLGLDCVDLLLVHWPVDDVPIDETMGAFAELVDAGQVTSVGVSNFSEEQLDAACAACPHSVTVNQVKYNVLTAPEALRAHCQSQGIVVTAWTPTTRGEVDNREAVRGAAAAHGKSATQVCLRWLVQKGVVVIPKSTSVDHLRENMDIFDWELSVAQMVALDGLG